MLTASLAMDLNGTQNQIFGSTFIGNKTPTLDYSSNEEPPYLIPLLCDPTDWTRSTAQAWQQSPFTESTASVSTNGSFYPDASWNSFDQSFAPSSQSPPHFELKSEFKSESAYGSLDGNEEYADLTSSQGQGHGYMGDYMNPLINSSSEPPHIFYREVQVHRNTKTTSKSKRSSSKPSLPTPITPTHQSPPHSGTSPHSPSSSSTPKTKQSRNKVEKQYRNRLNDEFHSLLQALPQDTMRLEWKKNAGARISKAEVLVLARERISELEEEGWCLERETELLREKVEELQKSSGNRNGGTGGNFRS